MKKQIISIFLLFMLIAPAVVTYSWLQQRKRAVKREVKWKMIAGIDKSELVLLKFSKVETTTKLQWKHSKEFEFNNQMYDIVDKIVSKDSIKYWCWWDFEETKLNKQLDNLLVGVFQHDSKSKEKQDLVYKFYKSIYLQPLFSWEPLIQSLQKNEIFTFCNLHKPKFIQMDLPPPKTNLV
ncbi:hypothetical protein [Flavobacterium sp.]|uniref:hypothetical protein n=1 Tax=Flavobacterium sp. TaxID=239 RepID=UPI0025C6B818|nr:hypothetical protein [Flavobacterium sp.]